MGTGTTTDSATTGAWGGRGLFADDELVDADNERVLALAASVEHARVRQLVALVAVAEESSFVRDGATSLTGWLTTRGGHTSRDANRLVKLVGVLRRVPGLLDVLQRGFVTVTHVEALMRVATDRRAGALSQFAKQLVANACALTADEFERICHRWAELVDEHMAEPAGTDGYWLNLTPSLFGEADINGHLTADQAEAVGRALDRLNGPDPVDSPTRRTVGQRNADALGDLARHFLSEPASKDDRPHTKATAPGSTPSRRRPALPTALLTIDLDTAMDRNRELGFADVGVQPDLAAIRCALIRGGSLPRWVAQLLSCDARMARFIHDAQGQPLDIGTPTPAVSDAQRIALHVRDKGCQFPTCTRPAHWCDAHHLRPRCEGGCTDLHNLVLLCRHHHRLVHSSAWRLDRDPETGIVSAIRRDATVYRRTSDGVVEVTEPRDAHDLDPPLRL
jgi:hypothetical protein